MDQNLFKRCYESLWLRTIAVIEKHISSKFIMVSHSKQIVEAIVTETNLDKYARSFDCIYDWSNASFYFEKIDDNKVFIELQVDNFAQSIAFDVIRDVYNILGLPNTILPQNNIHVNFGNTRESFYADISFDGIYSRLLNANPAVYEEYVQSNPNNFYPILNEFAQNSFGKLFYAYLKYLRPEIIRTDELVWSSLDMNRSAIQLRISTHGYLN